MAVPSTFADLSTTPGSNSGLISDATSVASIDDHMRSVWAFVGSISQNSGNGWTSPYLTVASPSYTGTLTGGTGVVNLGSGQVYKDASGNVGISTATPSYKLAVATSGDAVAAAFGQSGSGTGKVLEVGYYVSSDYARIQSVHQGTGFKPLALNPGGGNVGVGTTAPTRKLHVNGDVRIDGTTSTSATAGAASALPAAPSGYLQIDIGGTAYKVPYYAA